MHTNIANNPAEQATSYNTLIQCSSPSPPDTNTEYISAAASAATDEDANHNMEQYSIYDINDSLIEALTKNRTLPTVSGDFAKKRTNADKVRMVFTLLVKHDKLPHIPLCRTKDNVAAASLRRTGNKMFALKGVNLVKALELYNQSLCLTELGFSDFAINLANRSAVYFELRMTRACIQNIRFARLSRVYPERLMEKLAKREADCKQYEAESVVQEEWLRPTTARLKKPAHPVVPFISDALEMRQSEQFGRHVVATRRLVPGDVLCVEDAFTRVLLPSLRYQRCWNCLCEFAMNLLPCNRCTAVMFCSETCQIEADSTYHPYECPVIDYLLAVFNKIHLMAFRTALMGVVAFGSLDALATWLEEHGRKPVDVFSAPAKCMTGAKNAAYATHTQRVFHQVYSLQTNQEKRTISDMFQRTTIAAVQYGLLVMHTPLAAECKQSQRAQDTLMEMLLHFGQVCPTNFHSLESVESNVFEDSTYGTASYPFSSLLNHSCAPNVVRESAESQNVLVALRVIEPGEQLFDNYGLHHCLESVQMRRKQLRTQYRFHCECIACTKDYPPFVNLPVAPGVPEIVTEEDVATLQRYSLDCEDLYNKYCAFLKKYDKHYPCEQVAKAQECMKMCFSVLMRNVPLALRVSS